MKEKVETLMEETISLKEIFDILKKHVAAILISMFAGLALASVATFFIHYAEIQFTSPIDC